MLGRLAVAARWLPGLCTAPLRPTFTSMTAPSARPNCQLPHVCPVWQSKSMGGLIKRVDDSSIAASALYRRSAPSNLIHARCFAAPAAAGKETPKPVDPNFNKKKTTGARRYRNLIQLLGLLDEFGVGYRVARKNWIKFHPTSYWIVTRVKMMGNNKAAYGVRVYKGVAEKKEIKIRGLSKRDWRYLDKVEGEAAKVQKEAHEAQALIAAERAKKKQEWHAQHDALNQQQQQGSARVASATA